MTRHFLRDDDLSPDEQAEQPSSGLDQSALGDAT